MLRSLRRGRRATLAALVIRAEPERGLRPPSLWKMGANKAVTTSRARTAIGLGFIQTMQCQIADELQSRLSGIHSDFVLSSR
jgi:hypothetical protein